MDEPSLKTDLAQLDRSIDRSRKVVTGIVLAVLGIYLIWFWWLKDRALSDDSGSWGQFGDYAGGLLNPLVAYAAFYWLTRSVRLQKEELYETRKALQDSSGAQIQQAAHARTSLRINALTALINSLMVEVQTQRMQLQFIVDQVARKNSFTARLLDGTYKQGPALEAYVASINEHISTRMTERSIYEEELKQLLRESAA